jgi:hypothetical protein
MPNLNQDFILYKDSNLVLDFNFSNYNPTTVDGVWVMKTMAGETVITKTMGAGLTPFATKITLTILPSDTVNLEDGKYQHELRITDTGLVTAPVTMGMVQLREVLTSSVY